MEIGICIFIGIWFILSGLAAIFFFAKDFKSENKGGKNT